MTERDFVYWLQGFFDLKEDNKLTEKQVEIIRKHLQLVFEQKVDGICKPEKSEDKNLSWGDILNIAYQNQDKILDAYKSSEPYNDKEGINTNEKMKLRKWKSEYGETDYEFRMSDEDYDKLFKKSESDFTGIPLNTVKISKEDMEKQDIQDMNLTC